MYCIRSGLGILILVWGNDLSDTESYTKMHICSHIVYQRLLSIPVVQDALKKLYEYNESVFKDMGDRKRYF